MYKHCKKCDTTRTTNDFNKDSNKKDGLSTVCKDCRKSYRQLDYVREAHRLTEQKRRTTEKAKEVRRAYEQKYYSEGYGFLKKKYQTKLHNIIHNPKSEYSEELIGCSRSFFLRWLKFQFSEDMSFKNYGVSWCIDHCLPVKSFNLEDEDEVRQCYNWINLRPYRIDKNSAKHSKIDIFQYIMQEMRSNNFLKLNGYN
jgi:hypothetical protein